MAAVAGLLILVAVLFFWKSSSDRPSDDPATAVSLRCDGCQHEFKMTAGQVDDALRSKKAKVGGRGEGILFPCPKCGQAKAATVAQSNTP